MKEFKIRASSGSKIMTGATGLTDIQSAKLEELNGKLSLGKITDKQKEELNRLTIKRDNPELPAGAKTYCEMWLKQQLYARRREFTSKYTDKGNMVEEQSLETIRQFLGLEKLVKNDEYFDNEYSHGTPDVVETAYLVDAKNSWDCFSFPLFDDEIPYDENYWQGQVYMALTGKPLVKFIYVLSDTPEKLIINEAKSYCWKNGFEMCPKFVDEFREKLTYPNVPAELKIKCFDVFRNNADIEKIKLRVDMCRHYIKSLAK